MIYSMTYTDANLFHLLGRQIFFLSVGLVLLFLFSTINYRHLYRAGNMAYLASVGLLFAVFLFGVNVKGSVRWFDLGLFQVQPVEFAKIGLIIYLAVFFQKHIGQIFRFRTILLSAAAIAVPVSLTLLQPDLGSALVLVAIWLGMLVVAGVKRKHLLWLCLGMVLIGAVAWAWVLKDYQKDRLLSFLDPMSDPQGRGYNALQSIIATGSGGIFGRGLARGIVSGLRFLPERQTDFIFASLAEELGFVGAGFLLLALFGWFYRMIRIAASCGDNFSLFLAVGIFCYLFFQTVINIGMNIGLLPITGIPLPLISYGGSSMLAAQVSIGILESIKIHTTTFAK
jgi:rod shape determining protein RodA